MLLRVLLSLALLTGLLPFQTANARKKAYPGGKHFAYRYYLHDKAGSDFSTDHPSRFLSAKAIERRRRQHLPIDSTDLPVAEAYLKLFRARGASILATSRWNNTVVLAADNDSLLRQLALLPCVDSCRHVWTSPDSIDLSQPQMLVRQHYQRWDSLRGEPMGLAHSQIEQLRGERLHAIHLRGRGMTIAVLDGGFQNVNALPCFARTRIAGTCDFVPPVIGTKAADYRARADAIFMGIDHGTKVLSALAAQAPEVMAGTAPEASYWLLRCEDPSSETPIEEDFWAMAAEFADSVGADVINSSLGYHQYDAPFGNYSLKDLNGRTALISRTASMLASKGIVLCNSAGNAGMSEWKKIEVPADAVDILSVGAVGENGKNAAFSSIGPTHDGRVKPDIMAMGRGTTLISGRGTVVHDMGTSFSTPVVAGLVACLWQGLRDKSAREIIQLVRQSASQYADPDNIFGYGCPDFWQAYNAGLALPPAEANPAATHKNKE